MTSTKLYCVYLTTYSGNKLPMFYIGVSSVDNVQNGYRGSVRSNAYQDIWKQELKDNPHLFKTQIVCVYETRLEAEQKESDLQRKLKVVKSSMYINMTDGFTSSWCAKYPGQEHYLTNTTRHIDTRNGSLVCLKPSEVESYHVVDASKKGMVVAKSKSTNQGVYVTADEYHSNDDLVGFNEGKCTVYVLATGKTKVIDVKDYDKSIYMHTTTNKVCVFDLIDNESKHVTREEYHSNKSRYSHSSSGRKVAYDFELEEFRAIPLDEFYHNPDRFICPTMFYRRYQNIQTLEIIKIPMIDSEMISTIESSGMYVAYKISANRGKVWYKNEDTGETAALVEGTQPDGWVLGRIYHRNPDLYWFCNPERTQEMHCCAETVPEGWIRGRSIKPNKKSRAKGTMRWVHNPTTKERTMIQKDDPTPDGWINGSGYEPSAEANAARTAASKSRMWIYNATTFEETMILRTDPIPDGWVKGSLKIASRRDPVTGLFRSNK